MNEEMGSGPPENERKTKRCFVAAPASPEICDRATEIQGVLRQSPRRQGLRWLKTGAFHITLKFLGDVPVEDISYIAQQLGIVALGCWPTGLRLERLGVFPNPKRPRVLWWGSDGEKVPAELRALHFHVEEALHLLGFEKEDRPFRPHITIGRMKENVDPIALAEAMEQARPLIEAEFPIHGIELMESRLDPQGAIYESLAAISLEENDEERPAQEE